MTVVSHCFLLEYFRVLEFILFRHVHLKVDFDTRYYAVNTQRHNNVVTTSSP